MTSGHIRFGETNSSLQDPEVPPQAQRMNGPGLKNHRRINMRFVITGAASGIGRSCAELLAAGEAIAGEHQMLLADRDADNLAKTADAIGSAAATAVVDLAEPECGDRIVEAALARSEEHTSELQSLMSISYA